MAKIRGVKQRQVVECLKSFGIMTRDQIINLSFTDTLHAVDNCYKLMYNLVSKGLVKDVTTPEDGIKKYVYCDFPYNPRSNYNHRLALVDTFIEINKSKLTVDKYLVEIKRDKDIAVPDLTIQLSYKGDNPIVFCVEEQHYIGKSTNHIQNKLTNYQKLYDLKVLEKLGFNLTGVENLNVIVIMNSILGELYPPPNVNVIHFRDSRDFRKSLLEPLYREFKEIVRN